MWKLRQRLRHKISQSHYGCSTARNKGTCDNRLTIRREDVEARVLDGLRHHLMQPNMVKQFIAEFQKEANRQAAHHDQERARLAHELAKTERHPARNRGDQGGRPGAAVKDEMATLEARRSELRAQLERTPAPTPRLHPNLAEIYREKVANLARSLNEEHSRSAAAEAIRQLIEEVRLVPENGALKIELFGELAALIGLANKHPRSADQGVQITLVAGAGFHLYRTQLSL